ncbi:hypothetical protein AL073_03170 [Loktanella sp. 1ANDIMAR09]|nr:hypothetical protein AL073_03170 [Loktanella sp. 1ANDIMAR09]
MHDHAEVLYVLHIALIEIRATDNIDKARIFADVVHNVPMLVRADAAKDEIVAKVMLNAKRQGVDDYFSKLFEMAKNK